MAIAQLADETRLVVVPYLHAVGVGAAGVDAPHQRKDIGLEQHRNQRAGVVFLVLAAVDFFCSGVKSKNPEALRGAADEAGIVLVEGITQEKYIALVHCAVGVVEMIVEDVGDGGGCGPSSQKLEAAVKAIVDDESVRSVHFRNFLIKEKHVLKNSAPMPGSSLNGNGR